MREFFSPLSTVETWYYVVGYAYAVLMPIWPLRRIAELTHLVILRGQGVEEIETLTKHHRRDLPFFVGIIERTLYVASWMLGSPEFIGIWLALKVAGGWKGWSDDPDMPVKPGSSATVKITGRLFFNSHLIGSGLSVLGALVGALMIEWFRAGSWSRAVWLGILCAFFTASIWWWYEHDAKDNAVRVHAA